MVESGLLSAEGGFHAAQTFRVSELSESEAEELIPAGEVLEVAMAFVPLDTVLKLVTRHELHELRENRLALIHRLPPGGDGRRFDDAGRGVIS